MRVQAILEVIAERLRHGGDVAGDIRYILVTLGGYDLRDLSSPGIAAMVDDIEILDDEHEDS